MAFHVALDYHDGERKMQELLRVPQTRDNPTIPGLSQQAVRMLQVAPLIAVGVVDGEGSPWTTIWGGQAGMSQALGNSMIGIKTHVDRKHDPVVKALYGHVEDGEVVKEEGNGRMISGLAIDLMARKRVKLYGRLVAGAVSGVKTEDESSNGEGAQDESSSEHQIQLVCNIEQSLGNCPKYLNQRSLRPHKVDPILVSDLADLDPDAVKLILRSDIFFVSSRHNQYDMDTNHRGGPTGFVRPHQTESGAWEVYWPEYSGNRLYQTLGNLRETPLAGLVFPDFETGEVLYLTGRTDILVGNEAAHILPRSNLAVRLTVTGARFVKDGLPFRGDAGEPSPYNPKLRPLVYETKVVVPGDDSETTNIATLLKVKQLTPTIFKYTFSLSNPGTWTAGQWVALDLSSELDVGYSHMRDDDPTSLNDDFVRTFTVSSPPVKNIRGESDDRFEVTARTVGVATAFMSKQTRGDLDIPIRGFGGEVKIEQTEGVVTPIVAGGVGITPLMAQASQLDLSRIQLFFSIRKDDIGLAMEVINGCPGLAPRVALFVTGTGDGDETLLREAVDALTAQSVSCHMRRLQKEDLGVPGLGDRWYVCTSGALRKNISGWLAGKEIIFEDFNF